MHAPLHSLLLFGLSNLLLHLEASSDLRFDMVVDVAVTLADAILMVRLVLDKSECLLEDSRFLEIADIFRCHTLLVPQIVKHVLILFLGQLFLFELRHHKCILDVLLVDRDGKGVTR